MSLAQFLSSRLGEGRFEPRRAWAGRSSQYRPIRTGRRVWKSLGPVRFLTVHHAEGVPSEHPARMIRNIFTGHTSAQGRLRAADVGYHFFVDRNGVVWEGRDATHLGTHVGSTPTGLNNRGNLGICGLGTFTRQRPSRAMRESIAELCALIAEYQGRSLVVRGHREWDGVNGFHPLGGVDCPGQLDSAVRDAERRIASDFAPGRSGVRVTQASVRQAPRSREPASQPERSVRLVSDSSAF